MPYEINRVEPRDREWVARFIAEQWGSAFIVTRGRIRSAEAMTGMLAWRDDTRVGLAMYCIVGNECELVSLNRIKEKNEIELELPLE